MTDNRTVLNNGNYKNGANDEIRGIPETSGKGIK